MQLESNLNAAKPSKKMSGLYLGYVRVLNAISLQLHRNVVTPRELFEDFTSVKRQRSVPYLAQHNNWLALRLISSQEDSVSTRHRQASQCYQSECTVILSSRRSGCC